MQTIKINSYCFHNTKNLFNYLAMNLTSIIKIFILLFLYFPLQLQAELKLRAREHFDTVTIKYKELDIQKSHSGIGPAITLGIEDPYNYFIGFTYDHTFINNSKTSDIPKIGNNMELVSWAFEGKHFLTDEGGAFFRWGFSNNVLRTKGEYGNLKGHGNYLGLGWEFQLSEVGLAFEAAQKRIKLSNNIDLDIYSPSIGVHFYGYL